MEIVKTNHVTDPGRYVNTGKQFFVENIQAEVDKINPTNDVGVPVARKSAILCGVIPDNDGI